MTRTNAREIAIRICFASSSAHVAPSQIIDEFFAMEHYDTLKAEDEVFTELPDKKQMDYICRLTSLVYENCSELDGYIERYAKDWKIERISRTALAVLRCALCEILYMEDIPNATAIDEAVELDKNFDDPDVVSFVNGVLGGFMRGEVERLSRE